MHVLCRRYPSGRLGRPIIFERANILFRSIRVGPDRRYSTDNHRVAIAIKLTVTRSRTVRVVSPTHMWIEQSAVGRLVGR